MNEVAAYLGIAHSHQIWHTYRSSWVDRRWVVATEFLISRDAGSRRCGTGGFICTTRDFAWRRMFGSDAFQVYSSLLAGWEQLQWQVAGIFYWMSSILADILPLPLACPLSRLIIAFWPGQEGVEGFHFEALGVIYSSHTARLSSQAVPECDVSYFDTFTKRIAHQRYRVPAFSTLSRARGV